MDRAAVCDQFLAANSLELYAHQEEAILAWFTTDGGVLVSAPTGMGKTLIAEAAVFEALKTGRGLYYTTPLIALTDQKFRDLQAKADEWGFDRTTIGLLTGNRKVNPDAPVRVVVAEILLNHLLAGDSCLQSVGGVVMDEFHYFNDPERGVVWELSLALLPRPVRLMLLSATIGNPVEFIRWAQESHGRRLTLVQSNQRRVPLEFTWVGDELLTEFLPEMVTGGETTRRTPALVFCFNRDECWEVAERLKGVSLIDPATRAAIENRLTGEPFKEGIGPKLRQMLIRGIGVHHAGVLPRYKEIVEDLFLRKLVPFVICTETLAAGINLPARSVVLGTLLKGKHGEKKLVPPSTAHQIFGRAGRPQFDSQGYVIALAHEDDARIEKWRRKYALIDAGSKDPSMIRARKELERKRPTRRRTEQYWSEGQFKSLMTAGPAKLVSRGMIPYSMLVYLLLRSADLGIVRRFLAARFNTPEETTKFQKQLERMIDNLAALGYVTRSEDGAQVRPTPPLSDLLSFRSVDPLLGAYLAQQLVRADLDEKWQVLDALLPVPPALSRPLALPDRPPGPLQVQVLEPALIGMGIVLNREGVGLTLAPADDEDGYDDEAVAPRRLTLPEMLMALFNARLVTPEPNLVTPQWVAGGIAEFDGDFYKFVRARNLEKNEGIVLRHLLRVVILAGEFLQHSDGDPDYRIIAERCTSACQSVDERYTERFLAAEAEAEAALATAP